MFLHGGPGFGGELSDPSWRRFFDILKAKGVGGLRGGASAAGSNQIRGTDVQPSYLTYVNTMFDPRQESAVTGRNFRQENLREAAIQGQLPKGQHRRAEQYFGEELGPLPEAVRGLHRARGKRY